MFELELPTGEPVGLLHFEVMEKDVGSKDDFLGEATVDVAKLAHATTQHAWPLLLALALEDPARRVCAKALAQAGHGQLGLAGGGGLGTLRVRLELLRD